MMMAVAKPFYYQVKFVNANTEGNLFLRVVSFFYFFESDSCFQKILW